MACGVVSNDISLIASEFRDKTLVLFERTSVLDASNVLACPCKITRLTLVIECTIC